MAYCVTYCVMSGVSKLSFKFLHTLYVYRINVYICTFIDVTNILMCFKFLCQFGVGEQHFWNYPMYVSFQICGSKIVIFDFDDRMVYWKIIRFFENLKNLFCLSKLKTYDIVRGTRTWCYLRMDGCFRLRTYIVPSGSRPKQSTNEAEGRVYGWMGWDGISKVSFNFLHTLYVYRTCIYVLI